MKNIHSILSDLGITIPDDKKTEFDKAVAENYKTAAEFEKKVNRLSDDLAAEREAHNSTKESLKGFEGLGNAADVKKQLEESNQKIKEAQEKADKQIAARDLRDKVTAKMATSDIREDMRDYIYQELLNSGVSLNKNGDLIGYDEGLRNLKEKRPSAFHDKQQEHLEANRAQFTTRASTNTGTVTKQDIMAIKDDAERYRMIDQNRHLFFKKG